MAVYDITYPRTGTTASESDPHSTLKTRAAGTGKWAGMEVWTSRNMQGASLYEDSGAGVEVRGTKLQLLGTNVSGSELPNNQSENFSYLTLIRKKKVNTFCWLGT